MAIQHDKADKLAKLWEGGDCSHVWEKEFYLGTRTGDYRCSICGECISEETYKEYKGKQKTRKESNKNECN